MRIARTRPAVLTIAGLALAGVVACDVVGLPDQGSARTVATASTAGTQGVGDKYFPLDGNRGIDVAAYRIRQRWQPADQTLRGTTRLRVRTTSVLSSFNLDFLLPVHAVRINGRKVRHSRPNRHELRIVPRRPLAAGRRITVTVRYAGLPLAARQPGDPEAGMQWDNSTLSAVNQPHVAPFWFPSNDHPTDRARMDVTTTVPRGTQVVGNGDLVAHTRTRTSETWRWRSREPMASYLAFFVAGPLELTRSRKDSSWYAVSRDFSPAQRRRLLGVLRRTPVVTRWLEHTIGVDYPWTSNGGVMVPGLGFALETQGRPVYSDWAGTPVVVHEVAHQWFGDLVTIRRWSDIWLNEGFASYFEWDWAHSRGGSSVDRKLQRTFASRRSDTDYWKVAPGAPGRDNLFSEAVYERGAMTLAALRIRVGTTTFRRIVTTWVKEQAGRSASTAEFIDLAERVSGQDLSGFFDAWLYARVAPAVTEANGLA